jgi:hypothetical protein
MLQSFITTIHVYLYRTTSQHNYHCRHDRQIIQNNIHNITCHSTTTTLHQHIPPTNKNTNSTTTSRKQTNPILLSNKIKKTILMIRRGVPPRHSLLVFIIRKQNKTRLREKRNRRVEESGSQLDK